MIVMKFGGSSLATSDALTRVAGLIVDRIARRPVVVVSAMGRTTDGLVAAADLAARGELAGARSRVAAIRGDLLAAAAPVLADVAGLEGLVDAHCDELDRTLTELAAGDEPARLRLTDAALSHGERISSLVMARLLRQRGLDAGARRCARRAGDRRPVHRGGAAVRTDERAARAPRPASRGGGAGGGDGRVHRADGGRTVVDHWAAGAPTSAPPSWARASGPTRSRSGPTSTGS